MGYTNVSILWEAFYLSSLSTVGFFVAYVVALLLMFFIRWKTDKLQIIQDHEQGKFGWVMVFVEFIDALPEAAMLAQISVDGLPYESLLAALFVMNFANGFSTTFDMMATIKSRIVYATMFVVLHFSVGLLSYAISVSVYAHFGDELIQGKRNESDLHALYIGTCVGSLFVACNMAFHHWSEETFSKVNLGEDSKVVLRKAGSAISLLSENNFENYLSVVTKEDQAVAPEEHEKERKKFFAKIFQTFIILLLLYVWTVGWTMIIASIFLYMQSPETHQSLNMVGSFLEGVGGGAFLSTIACTVLVKINECYESMNITDRSHDKWKKIVATATRTFFFIAGLIIANMIDVSTKEKHI